jgi:hypothetical protein
VPSLVSDIGAPEQDGGRHMGFVRMIGTSATPAAPPEIVAPPW